MGLKRPSLGEAIAALARTQGTVRAPAAFADAWASILWENVAYLADDQRRLAAFRRLRDEVGLDARALLRADDATLHAICAAGILAGNQVAKLRRCARLLAGGLAGDPAALVAGGDAAVRRAVKKFPGIGDPGADRILLFALGRAVPALESNGLRALQRLGFAVAHPSYAVAYRSARAALTDAGFDAPELKRAYLVLRRHGQRLCRRSTPECGACPLRRGCPAA